MPQPEDARQTVPEPRPAPLAAARTRRPPEFVPETVLERARGIAAETGHELLQRVVANDRCELQTLNNSLMDCFRELGSVEAYTLLFELNLRPFSLVAARVMRMTSCRADINDVIQESFLAIYRYPTRFRPDKPNAFRNWSYSIIRNTVYRHLNQSIRDGIPADMLADVLEDTKTASPARATEEAETGVHCSRVYALMLLLYSHAYEHELNDRARLALDLVEVQGMGYRDAADVLGIKLENFKMVVCRARKKIVQSMVRVLGTRLP